MPSTEQVLADLVQRVASRFFGRYRGIVVDNADPEHLGRLRVSVPSVLGPDVVSGWATPCAPYGGGADHGFLFVPDPGDGVWVEFEEGDLEFPIWTGTFWSRPGGESELPRPDDAGGRPQDAPQDPPTRKIIKTTKGHTLQFEDADGAEQVTLVEAVSGHVVTLGADGITVHDGLHGHRIALGADGVTVSDGLHDGNRLTTSALGVTIADANGNAVVLGPSGVQVGSSGASQPLVLGATLAANVAAFLALLNSHTHVTGLPGSPTGPPLPQMQLQVPLSPKHKAE
jgi:uncharacterized protein involved in type VI secretion and phage assembly